MSSDEPARLPEFFRMIYSGPMVSPGFIFVANNVWLTPSASLVFRSRVPAAMRFPEDVSTSEKYAQVPILTIPATSKVAIIRPVIFLITL